MDDPIEETLRRHDIPIIDVDNVTDIRSELVNYFTHADRTEKMITADEEKKLKIILAKLARDYVKPYKNWGSYIPFVLYSTHPEYHKGLRMNKGFIECSLEEGYLFVLISPDGEKLENVKKFLETDWRDQNYG